MTDIAKPRSAATVILLRDGPQGLETLLLKRNKALLFAGGVWVFPGGALDPADWEAANGEEMLAARVACAREAREEADISVDPDVMVQLSHWTTPEAEPKRFYTWFFLALAPSADTVVIDGSEIHDHQWIAISEAIRQHEAAALGMFPPTIMTLRALHGYLAAEEAMIGVAARDPQQVLPVFARVDGEVMVMFAGDAGYSNGDPTSAGARHRACLSGGAWHYQHEGVEAVARLDA